MVYGIFRPTASYGFRGNVTWFADEETIFKQVTVTQSSHSQLSQVNSDSLDQGGSGIGILDRGMVS